VAKNAQGVHNHISSPTERRRELGRRIEPDDHPESDAVAHDQHPARVYAAAVGAVQKGLKSKGCNAAKEVVLTV